jgi:hypothetical protein
MIYAGGLLHLCGSADWIKVAELLLKYSHVEHGNQESTPAY